MHNVLFTGVLDFNYVSSDSGVGYALPEGFNINTDTPVLENGVVRLATALELEVAANQRIVDKQEASARKQALSGLLIQAHLPTGRTTNEAVIRAQDFTTIGLEDGGISYGKRGNKLKAEYIDPNTGLVAVRKRFYDQKVNGKLQSLRIVFEWLDANGVVQLTKTRIKKFLFPDGSLDQVALGNLERKRRLKAFDYLVSGATNLQVYPILERLFTYYKEQLDEWKDIGSNRFRDLVFADYQAQKQEVFADLHHELIPYLPGVRVFMSILASQAPLQPAS